MLLFLAKLKESLGRPIGADRLWGAEQSCGEVTGSDLDRGGENGGREAWLMRPPSA